MEKENKIESWEKEFNEITGCDNYTSQNIFFRNIIRDPAELNNFLKQIKFFVYQILIKEKEKARQKILKEIFKIVKEIREKADEIAEKDYDLGRGWDLAISFYSDELKKYALGTKNRKNKLWK